MVRAVVVALVVAGCSQPAAPASSSPRREPAREACGSETCAQNEVCYHDARREGSIDNPYCRLAPAACAHDVTCECLLDQMRMSVCDDTGDVTKVTLFP